MRKTSNFENQMKLGQVDISEIKISVKSRDEIPQLLRALQFIYCNLPTRKRVFGILEKEVPVKDVANGRPGMDLWQILVLAVLRLNCDWNWDKIEYMANTHGQIRQMMGIPDLDDKEFSLQTLKDNVNLLKPETIASISALVVETGHKLIKKKDGDEGLHGRCDSFVVETNVHFPTDINLLLDAMRKVIFLVAALCLKAGVPGWRKFAHNFGKIKKLYRKCQKMKHSTSQSEEKKKERETLIVQAFQAYLDIALVFLERARESVEEIKTTGRLEFSLAVIEVERYMAHAERQIDQIQRRVLEGEVIPHDEKVFSIFEEHTEWISKGKAGVPVELGLRVCVLEDQHGFILHHRVMEGEVDVDVAVPMVEGALEKFAELKGVSFDKGFWSPANKRRLEELIEQAIMPKKGKLSGKDKEREGADEFGHYRRKHSAVESGINALENHGLDRCPDRGVGGFKRYVALAVLGRNLQKLGAVLQKKERKKLKRRKSAPGGLKKAA